MWLSLSLSPSHLGGHGYGYHTSLVWFPSRYVHLVRRCHEACLSDLRPVEAERSVSSRALAPASLRSLHAAISSISSISSPRHPETGRERQTRKTAAYPQPKSSLRDFDPAQRSWPNAVQIKGRMGWSQGFARRLAPVQRPSPRGRLPLRGLRPLLQVRFWLRGLQPLSFSRSYAPGCRRRAHQRARSPVPLVLQPPPLRSPQ
jgi:hypothetical protein